jgi:hypothetical protein
MPLTMLAGRDNRDRHPGARSVAVLPATGTIIGWPSGTGADNPLKSPRGGDCGFRPSFWGLLTEPYLSDIAERPPFLLIGSWL